MIERHFIRKQPYPISSVTEAEGPLNSQRAFSNLYLLLFVMRQPIKDEPGSAAGNRADGCAFASAGQSANGCASSR